MKFTQYQFLMKDIFKKEEAQERLSQNSVHPLVLAYIGDACFNLFVRTRLLEYEKRKVRVLHNSGACIVSATMQACALRELEAELSQEELDLVRRGRNAKSTVPKSATIADYRYSTGFEALLGFLLLSDKQERLQTLCDKAFAVISREITDKCR